MKQITYTIGEFSTITGLSIDTLRYYEKKELIKPVRNATNQRRYTDNDFKWIEFILRLKNTGMSLQHIHDYAILRYQGDATIPARLQLLFSQLENLHHQQQSLENNITFLEHKIKIYVEQLESLYTEDNNL